MTIDENSKASVVGASVENVQFQPAVSVVVRKINIIATYDSALLDIEDNVPVRIFSANEAGSRFGFGSMIHRLAEQAFAGSRGNVDVWVTPQPEETGTQAEGSIDFAGTSGVKAATLHLYVASLYAPVNLIDSETPENIVIKIAAAVDAVTGDKKLPADATSATTIATFTAKSNGEWGNGITLAFNLRPGETLPAGVAAAITDMSGGTGTPDVQDALDGMGVGDNQNEEFFTDLVCGYGVDTTTQDKISVYNGVGNQKTGNWKEEISRPFRALVGDTAPGTAGLSALIAAAELRREQDRTGDTIGIPGNFHHPMELAAVSIGVMARINNLRAQQNYLDQILPGILPGPSKDRWTDNNEGGRDLAIRSGVSTTQVKNNTVTLQDVITYYRPEAVDPNSNGYRSMRNISILQNQLANIRAEWESENWKGISIVEDSAIVRDLVDQEKVKDNEDVKDTLLIINELFAGKSWIFSKAFFVERLKADSGLVSLRTDGRGWDIKYQTVLSGEGGIFNVKIQFDVSLAVFIN